MLERLRVEFLNREKSAFANRQLAAGLIPKVGQPKLPVGYGYVETSPARLSCTTAGTRTIPGPQEATSSLKTIAVRECAYKPALHSSQSLPGAILEAAQRGMEWGGYMLSSMSFVSPTIAAVQRDINERKSRREPSDDQIPRRPTAHHSRIRGHGLNAPIQ